MHVQALQNISRCFICIELYSFVCINTFTSSIYWETWFTSDCASLISPSLLTTFRYMGVADSEGQKRLENTDIFKLSICIRSVSFGWKMLKQSQEKVNSDQGTFFTEVLFPLGPAEQKISNLVLLISLEIILLHRPEICFVLALVRVEQGKPTLGSLWPNEGLCHAALCAAVRRMCLCLH